MQLVAQQPNGRQEAQKKVAGLTRYLSEFTGVVHLELRDAESQPVILRMEAA